MINLLDSDDLDNLREKVLFMENLLNRITIDDEVCNGRPTIRGYRLTVQTILEFLLSGSTAEEIIEAYPFLERKDIDACRLFATHLMDRHFTIKPLAA